MMGRLIDVEKLLDVLFEEREHKLKHDTDAESYARFTAISDCIGIINHMPEYDEKTSRTYLTVGEVKARLLKTSNAAVVLKREDNGREYRKIKDVMDKKYDWEVTGFMPRIKADGTFAKVELVLWCKDRKASVKELHDRVMADVVCDKFGVSVEKGVLFE